MRKIMYVISILLSLWMIYLAFFTFLEGAFSQGSAVISLKDHIIVLDYEWQGILLMALGVCFILNMKWISQRKYISLPIVILFTINLVGFSIYDAYPNYLYIQTILLIVIYIINIFFVNGKEKISK